MSKRIALLLLVTALSAAAIYGYFIYPSQQAEDVLDDFLASNPFITASEHGPVVYDVAKGDLKVEKLRISLSAPRSVSLEISLLEAEGISTETDSLTGINNLTLRGIKILTPTGAHRIGEIFATEVKIDTNVLDPAQNITIADIAQAIMSRSVQVTGVKILVEKKAAQISLNKAHLSGYQKGSVEEFQIEGLQAREPNAKSYFSLETLTMKDLDARQALRNLSENQPLSLDQLWARNITLSSFAFQDDDRGPIAVISEIQIKRGNFVGRWPQTANFSMRDMEINTSAATGAVDTSMLRALGYETIQLSTNLMQEWEPEAGRLRLTDGALILNSGGTLSYSFDFNDVDAGFFEAGPMPVKVLGLKMEAAAIGYQDDGLLERIIANSATRSGLSPQQAKTQLLENIRVALSGSPLAPMTDEISIALTELLNKGGKIALTARPDTSVSFANLLQKALSGEVDALQTLNLDVRYSRP